MNFNVTLMIFMVSLISSCAHRTPYGPLNSSGGYADGKFNDRIEIARFAGNGYTHADDALTFARFRALEVCTKRGFRITRYWDVKDNTSSQTVQRSDAYATALSKTSAYATGSTWNETYRFPTYDQLFSCLKEAKGIGVALKVISKDDMKPYVNDLMEGLQVESFQDYSKNKSVLKVGDIIVKIGTERVRSVSDISFQITESERSGSVPATLVREGKQIGVSLFVVDLSQLLIANQEAIRTSACTVPELKRHALCSRLKN